MAYWLLKTEPDAYSWDDQVKKGAKGDAWTGVRNFAARKNLQAMKKGDRAFFYHTGDEKQVVGIVEIIKEAYKDPTDQPAVGVDPLRHGPGVRAVYHPRHRPLAQRRGQEHHVRGRAHRGLRAQADAHLTEPCPLALQVQDAVLGIHGQVQIHVAQRLPARQLDGDGQAVLLRVRDGVDALALGVRHGGAHARQLPAVLHAVVHEQEVRQEEDGDTQQDTRDDARVRLSELAPAWGHSTSTAALSTYRRRSDREPVCVPRWAAPSLTLSVRSMYAKVRAIESWPRPGTMHSA